MQLFEVYNFIIAKKTQKKLSKCYFCLLKKDATTFEFQDTDFQNQWPKKRIFQLVSIFGDFQYFSPHFE